MLAFAGAASAGVINSQISTGLGFGDPLGVREVSFRLTLSQPPSAFPCFVASPTCFVVLDQAMTAADLGRTFSFTAADPSFAAIADVLTENRRWLVFHAVLESRRRLRTMPTGAPNGQPDFQGYVLSGIDITLTAFQSQDFDFGGILFTDNVLDLTLSVEGSTPTPEPATIMLLAAGLAILAVAQDSWPVQCRARRALTASPSRLRESAPAGTA